MESNGWPGTASNVSLEDEKVPMIVLSSFVLIMRWTDVWTCDESDDDTCLVVRLTQYLEKKIESLMSNLFISASKHT